MKKSMQSTKKQKTLDPPLKRSHLRLIRLLQMTQILQQSAQAEKTLRKRFKVSRATLYRDLRMLRQSGLRIKKQEHEFSLKGFELSLEEEKVLQLALSALLSLTAVPYERALKALVVRFDLARARVRILQNPLTRLTTAQEERFRQLAQLCHDGKGCWLRYQPPGVTVVQLKIFPKYLLFKRRAWYVLAIANWAKAAKPQLYRLNRIREIKPLPEECPYWLDDLQSHFQNAWEFRGGEQVHKVVLRILTERARDLIQEVQWHQTQKVVKRQGGWIFEVEVADPEEMVPWVLQFGAEVEVVEPKALRERIRQGAQALLQKYSSHPR